MKEVEKKKAIELRKKGLTYSEILEQIPVAKSTLSLWLREVGLSKPQKQKITKRRLEAGLRGGAKRREMRIERTKEIVSEACKEIDKISKRELWLIGIALYWAEGSKEKEWSRNAMMDFTNSDARMIRLYIKWLDEIFGISEEGIKCGIYIHENSKNRIDQVINFWSKQTGFSKSKFNYVYFKKHNIKTKRKNIGESYFGGLRIRVNKSTDLNRKVAGWINGVVDKTNCGIV